MSDHPWEWRPPEKSRAARRARRAYLFAWSDRMRLERLAGLTDAGDRAVVGASVALDQQTEHPCQL